MGATKIQLANTTLCLDGGPKSEYTKHGRAESTELIYFE